MSNRPVRAPLAAILLAVVLVGCAEPAPPVVQSTPVGIDLGSSPGKVQPPVPAAPVAAPVAAPMAAHVAATGVAPAPAKAADHHGHHPSTPAGAATGHATIDAIDADRRRVTLSHEPMPKIGWPAMTMVFPAPQGIDLSTFRAGDHVDFSLMKNPDGSYRLQSMHPVHH